MQAGPGSEEAGVELWSSTSWRELAVAWLGGRLAGTELADALELALPQYGQLQRDLAPEADRMLELGVTDMRAAVMPQRFDEALEAVGEYVERRGGPDERATCRRVAALDETVGGWCDRLALTWDRTVTTLDPDEVDEEWARAPFHSLASLLDDSYLGGA